MGVNKRHQQFLGTIIVETDGRVVLSRGKTSVDITVLLDAKALAATEDCRANIADVFLKRIRKTKYEQKET
jgi:hypothetical protein